MRSSFGSQIKLLDTDSLSPKFKSVWQHLKDKEPARAQAGFCRLEVMKDEVRMKIKTGALQ